MSRVKTTLFHGLWSKFGEAQRWDLYRDSWEREIYRVLLGFLYEMKSEEIKNNKYAWHIYVLYVKITLLLGWLVLVQ